MIRSDDKAKTLGLTPLALIMCTAVRSLSQEIMGLGSVTAIRIALRTSA